jgi:hypothetical protein
MAFPVIANSDPLLFPLAAGDLVVPDHINAFVIHPDAANDPSRRTLLSKLQARDATKAEVCSIIMQSHMSPGLIPRIFFCEI